MGDDAEPGMAESTVHLSFDRTAIECVAAAAYAVRGRKEYRDAVCNALPDPLLVGLDRLYAFVLQGYDGKPVILICLTSSIAGRISLREKWASEEPSYSEATATAFSSSLTAL